MNNLSDGLFTVQCECGIDFPAENLKCSCGLTKGPLQLDVDRFLDKVYDVSSTMYDVQLAVDLVFEVFWQLYDKYDIMNQILEKTDPSKIDIGTSISILTNTFKYSKQIPNHKIFFNKVYQDMLRRGKTKEESKTTLKGLEGVGDFWKRMEMYGATDSLIFGPRPKDS